MVYTVALYARAQVISLGSAMTYEEAKLETARSAYDELMKSVNLPPFSRTVE